MLHSIKSKQSSTRVEREFLESLNSNAKELLKCPLEASVKIGNTGKTTGIKCIMLVQEFDLFKKKKTNFVAG